MSSYPHCRATGHTSSWRSLANSAPYHIHVQSTVTQDWGPVMSTIRKMSRGTAGKDWCQVRLSMQGQIWESLMTVEYC